MNGSPEGRQLNDELMATIIGIAVLLLVIAGGATLSLCYSKNSAQYAAAGVLWYVILMIRTHPSVSAPAVFPMWARLMFSAGIAYGIVLLITAGDAWAVISIPIMAYLGWRVCFYLSGRALAGD